MKRIFVIALSHTFSSKFLIFLLVFSLKSFDNSRYFNKWFIKVTILPNFEITLLPTNHPNYIFLSIIILPDANSCAKLSLFSSIQAQTHFLKYTVNLQMMLYSVIGISRKNFAFCYYLKLVAFISMDQKNQKTIEKVNFG